MSSTAELCVKSPLKAYHTANAYELPVVTGRLVADNGRGRLALRLARRVAPGTIQPIGEIVGTRTCRGGWFAEAEYCH